MILSDSQVQFEDVGAEVARLLVQGWNGRTILEIGPYLTPVQIAAAMAQVPGKPVEARAIPPATWSSALTHMGLSPEQATNWAEIFEGFNSGWINFGRPGTDTVPGSRTPYQVFAAALGRNRRSHE